MTELTRIRLNFLKIKPQSFEFHIWRKRYEKDNQIIKENIFRYSLPNIDGTRQEYWISFDPEDDYEPYQCRSRENIQLTLKFLYLKLLKISKRHLLNRLYYVEDRFRPNRIYYVINEFQEGVQTIWMEPYYLESQNAFGFLINFQFKKREGIKYSKEIQRLSLSLDEKYRSNRNFYIDKYRLIQQFIDTLNSKISYIHKEKPRIKIIYELVNVQVSQLKERQYIVKNSSNSLPYLAIKESGPLYSLNKPIKLIYICEKNDEYLVNELTKALEGKYYTFKGFEKFFRCRLEKADFIIVNELSINKSKTILRRVIEAKEKYSDIIIVPIFIFNKDDMAVYYYYKELFLKARIPFQVVTKQLLKKREQLKWSISNIALQIFSKAGGKPWKVLDYNSNSLIFGIGQAHEKTEDGIIKRYRAYSICFDSSGILYRIDVLGDNKDERLYLKELQKNILETLKNSALDRYDKVVVHVSFKIRYKELEKIREAIDTTLKSRKKKIKFYVVRINEENKFFGFAYSNSLVPIEGTFTELSTFDQFYLLWIKGLQKKKTVITDRIPGPLFVDIYYPKKRYQNESVNQDDKLQILQDIYNLAGASWRGFNSLGLPITIKYCKIISNFLKNFPEKIQKLEDISLPWFL